VCSDTKPYHLELALRAYFNLPLNSQIALINNEKKSVEISNVTEGTYILDVKEQTENLTESISDKQKKHIYFNLTGFGEFQGVKNNPTQTLMKRLTKLLKKSEIKTSKESTETEMKDEETEMKDEEEDWPKEPLLLPDHIKIENLTVFETAGRSSAQTFHSLDFSKEKNARCVWLHFGVASSYKSFALENQAYNEADFRVPDQQGWSPKGQQIVTGNQQIAETSLPIKDIFQSIRLYGQPVYISSDPGRFVCNWIYYHSLTRSSLEKTSSFFVHVPPYKTIPYEKQLEFVVRLICVLAELLQ